VFFSLLVARFVTPMMAAYMMKAKPAHEKPDGFLMRNYLSVIRGALKRRWIPVVGVLAFFGLTVLMLGHLSTGFFPASDSSQTQVKITTAPGTTIAETDAVSRKVSAALKGVDHVQGVFQATGSASSGGMGGGSQTSSVTSATIVVDLTNIDDRDVTQVDIEAGIRDAVKDIPGARIEVGSGGNGTQLQLTLAGDNSQTLVDASSTLANDIRAKIAGIGNVTTSASIQSPEIVITPDLARAASYGVTSQSISNAIRVATSGAYDSALSQLNLPERQIPIRVTLAEQTRQSLDQIKLIPVPGSNGNVTLGAIAQVTLGSSPAQINRLDRSRNVSVTVELNGRNLSDVNKEVAALSSYQNLPAGVKFVEQGDLKRQSELFSSFGTAMALGVFCVYAVLVLLFHDFLQPITILTALPLALGGALFPLVMTGTSFSMPAVIGLLLLMGIVSKNSILLVDYVLSARRSGMSRYDALVDACHKRARPIIMTTVAMSAGMLPAALSLMEGDSSFRQPMATVVIGGLATSTLLSLLVIPVMYTFIDDFERFVTGRFRKADPALAPKTAT
jgi:multidrug efflux pump subunit AcrB